MIRGTNCACMFLKKLVNGNKESKIDEDVLFLGKSDANVVLLKFYYCVCRLEYSK